MTDKSDWFEDDDFWQELEPFMFPPRLFENTTNEVDAVIDLLVLPTGANILDLCCGFGRHSIELTRREFNVTGVDRTSYFLEKARQHADSEELDVEFIQEDMRNFKRIKTFECVLSMFTSFGYFKDPDDDRRVLDNIYASLKDNGVFLLDTMGKERLAKIFLKRDWEEIGDVFLLHDRSIQRDWSWCENRWIIVKGGERKDFTVSHRLYSAVEIKQLLTETGFSNIKVYGSLKGIPYDQNATRLVVKAQKVK